MHFFVLSHGVWKALFLWFLIPISFKECDPCAVGSYAELRHIVPEFGFLTGRQREFHMLTEQKVSTDDLQQIAMTGFVVGLKSPRVRSQSGKGDGVFSSPILVFEILQMQGCQEGIYPPDSTAFGGRNDQYFVVFRRLFGLPFGSSYNFIVDSHCNPSFSDPGLFLSEVHTKKLHR